MTERPSLLFISTRFLFPADSGGKIRTSQVLRGLKGGKFKIKLAMPSDCSDRERYSSELNSVCDELVSWEPATEHKLLYLLKKMTWVLNRYPIPVMSDWNEQAQHTIEQEISRNPELVVFDFPHSAILGPKNIDCASVLFTHNIEAEIFKRHLEVARSPIHKWIWQNQHRKMVEFERDTLCSFDGVIAVSERDCHFFREEYGVTSCNSIPTGVDTEFFEYIEPANSRQVVFCGSMDWMANIDGIEFFYNQVWPIIINRVSDARMKVVGRTPPQSLVNRITQASPEWDFTGFVDDIRGHVGGAAAFVIPLRVGGGTRIKAFEAMAMGCPVVSTSIGMEGLPVEDGKHYLNADTQSGMADCVISLMTDKRKRTQISRYARDHVESQFGFRKAAAVFEDACLDTVHKRNGAPIR